MYCVQELFRAIMRGKPITLLLPDSEVHGAFTEEMIRSLVTEQWLKRFKVERMVAKWAREWGVEGLKVPTPQEILDLHLFRKPALEWSRISNFQDRTMVLMTSRVIPEQDVRTTKVGGERIYLQGEATFGLAKDDEAIQVYCSQHNAGAKTLAEELEATWPGFLEVVEDIEDADAMLVYAAHTAV